MEKMLVQINEKLSNSNGGVGTNGLDAVFTNIAGLAFTDKTQIRFDRTNWLGGTGININSDGI